MEQLKEQTFKNLEYLKDARIKKGYSVADLSRKSGVSIGVISELENNMTKMPSLANFIALARALDLPKSFVTNLIYGEDKEETYISVTAQEIGLAINKYNDLIKGITIDRGCGDEYFDVIAIVKGENPKLVLDSEDDVDTEWLASCDKIEFALKGSMIIKNTKRVKIEMSEDELSAIVKILLSAQDRLLETNNTSANSIVEDANELPNKVRNIITVIGKGIVKND